MNRRQAFRRFLGFAAGSPLLTRGLAAQTASAAMDDVNGPVNVHEFEEIARKKLNKLAYDFIAGGVEDEHTLAANRAAYSRVFIVPRMMVDTSKVDTSLELFGMKLDAPVIIAPTGGKNLVIPDAESIVARAAARQNTLICSASSAETTDGRPPDKWWSNTTGQATKELAQRYAKRMEDRGAKAIVVTCDNPYQSTRDRNNRNRFDYGMMSTGVPRPGETRKPVQPALAGMWVPHTPNMTWDYVGWLRGAVKIPVLLKGILHPEDAELAVQRGASAIVVSNHGGRQLDGALATLDALPDVVDAVGGRIPVLMDGGIRRGSDILKALALGAKAVLVGRAPLWGLGAFGQAGVERVLWMLAIELKVDMAQAGVPNLAAINRKMARRIG